MKYHANVVINWDFKSNLPYSEIIQKFQQEFSRYGKADILIKPIANNDKTQIGVFTPEEILSHVSNKDIKKDFVCHGQTYNVKMNSQRYFLFRECSKCVACGIEGTKFILEYHEADKTPHFNLYAEENDELILLTRDHIKPKALGGYDYHSNYQTMCSICNNLKGHRNLHLHEIKKLRNFYNEKKGKLGKKKFHLLIEKKKFFYEQKKTKYKPAKKKTSDSLAILNCDLNICQQGEDFLGIPVYDSVPKNTVRVGCIKRGTALEVLLFMNKRYLCKLDHETGILINSSHLKV